MNLQEFRPDPLAPYPQMYVVLFKSITGALQLMEAGEFMLARTMLVRAQQDAEEMYLEDGDKDEENDTSRFLPPPMGFLPYLEE